MRHTGNRIVGSNPTLSASPITTNSLRHFETAQIARHCGHSRDNLSQFVFLATISRLGAIAQPLGRRHRIPDLALGLFGCLLWAQQPDVPLRPLLVPDAAQKGGAGWRNEHDGLLLPRIER
jgi:hypothetical protein